MFQRPQEVLLCRFMGLFVCGSVSKRSPVTPAGVPKRRPPRGEGWFVRSGSRWVHLNTVPAVDTTSEAGRCRRGQRPADVVRPDSISAATFTGSSNRPEILCGRMCRAHVSLHF